MTPAPAQQLAAALKEHQDTCPRVPPGRTHLPRAQVLGRDGVRHSAGRPHTCPPEGHRDDVAGGARGCWVFD